MAISNYTDLVAAVKDFTVRTDTAFANAIDNFIILAEQRMYYGNEDENSPPLRVKEMQTTGTLAFTSGSAPLPAGYLDMRSINRDADGAGLDYLPPERFEVMKANIPAASSPGYFTIIGSTVKLVPEWTGNLNIVYNKAHDALTSGAPTNDVLTGYPALYLQGILAEAYDWLENDIKHGKALNKYNGAVRAANRSTGRGQQTGSQLRMMTRRYV